MLKQTLQQKLLQKLSPQQIQLMKMLQLPTMALEQRIKEEMEINPALEDNTMDDNDVQDEDINSEDEYEQDGNDDTDNDFDISDYLDDDETPDYKLTAKNKGADDEYKEIPYSSGKTFHEMLETQLGLRLLSENEKNIGKYLIGNLDDSGYLRRELRSIVDDIAFSLNLTVTEDDLERVLKIIQEFDPAGVGARTLQECLQLQIERKDDSPETLLAKRILKDYFEEFTKKHYEKISKSLDIQDEELKPAIDEILKLNPKPGNSLSETSKITEHITPDFLLGITDGQFDLQLNSRNAPELKVSRKYSEMLETYSADKEKSRAAKEAVLFVKQKIDSARWFIDAIQQRQNTLLITMQAILEYQQEYFKEGDETKLKPMILKDIADMVGLDISTVSRVANSKYIQTPYGTFLLKSFFSESLSTDSGEEVSTREVKKILQDVIGAEDKRKPVTDDKLAQLLKQKGYNIARRTVAKYREQLNIPVARLRKEL